MSATDASGALENKETDWKQNPFASFVLFIPKMPIIRYSLGSQTHAVSFHLSPINHPPSHSHFRILNCSFADEPASSC